MNRLKVEAGLLRNKTEQQHSQKMRFNLKWNKIEDVEETDREREKHNLFCGYSLK